RGMAYTRHCSFPNDVAVRTPMDGDIPLQTRPIAPRAAPTRPILCMGDDHRTNKCGKQAQWFHLGKCELFSCKDSPRSSKAPSTKLGSARAFPACLTRETTSLRGLALSSRAVLQKPAQPHKPRKRWT